MDPNLKDKLIWKSSLHEINVSELHNRFFVVLILLMTFSYDLKPEWFPFLK